MEAYCSPSFFLDSDHRDIIEFSRHHVKDAETDRERAVRLYYAVRDTIRYDPYGIDPDPGAMKASQVLHRGKGYCVAKAVLLAACLRSRAIPARLGFADVKNHLNTERLRKRMGTDLFVWHGYTDIYLNGKWVKATPAFNLELCRAFGVVPLAFDGTEDSVFQPFDTKGNRHLEYVRDHGRFADLPWETIWDVFEKTYPDFFKAKNAGDFRADALAEKGGAIKP